MMSGISAKKTKHRIMASFLKHLTVACTRCTCVCISTHQTRCPHTALALARWSVWRPPLWRHGDDLFDLWSRSPAQSALVPNQTFGGIYTYTKNTHTGSLNDTMLQIKICFRISHLNGDWKKPQMNINHKSLTFQPVHRHLFWCKLTFLDPTVPETTTASHLRVKRQINKRKTRC